VRGVEEAAALVEGAVLGRELEVRADVVAEVALRALVERRQPERLDAEVAQVVEPVDHPGEVPDAVAGEVIEGARVDLVDDGALPPRRVGTLLHAAV
jgi:hypothetical protein